MLERGKTPFVSYFAGKRFFGKNPESSPDPRAGTPLEQDLAAVNENEPGRTPRRLLLARARRRQLANPSVAARDAIEGDRATLAGGVRARAECRAEVHQALGVRFDAALRQQPLGERPLRARAFDTEATRENAPDVSVKDRRALAEGKYRNRRGGRAPDA